ncbi:MAG TPA: hypothetical protein VEM36_00325, partial [Xanthobacteraceae bacterium]|nr:hypothetical protein [Xanthobacteraceae bacterium]
MEISTRGMVTSGASAGAQATLDATRMFLDSGRVRKLLAGGDADERPDLSSGPARSHPSNAPIEDKTVQDIAFWPAKRLAGHLRRRK